ncbi:MAG: type II secretion system F family protein [Zoogloeaceae bacterium]|jgi:type IV pilus assembly protein PilC|nr:type II secretion system F family protein [Zoogloeaceae bacterium]
MRYEYRAIDQTGRRVSGALEATGTGHLETRLETMGLYLLTAREARRSPDFSRRIPRREWLHFWFQLKELLMAGVALQDALTDLCQAQDSRLQAVIAALIDDITAGRTLSQAMQAQERHFPPVFVCLIRAGETAGKLPEAVESLLAELSWEDELADKTRRVLIYPAFVAAVILAATLFLLFDLVPQLQAFLINMGEELPWQTRALFGLSRLLREYGIFLLPVGAALLFSLFLLSACLPGLRLYLDALVFRLPMFGPLWQKISLSRFAGAFALLYASGITVMEAMEITRGISANRALQKALMRAETRIHAGSSLHQAFAESALFPPFVIRMLRVGETTGALDRSLANVRHFYNRDVEAATLRAERLVEPVLTLVLGLLLGWIMLAVIGPIYEIIRHVGF